MRNLCGLMVVALVASLCNAQSIRVAVRDINNSEVSVGADRPAGNPITLNLSQLISFAGDPNVEFLRVWDPVQANGQPNDAVGNVTIRVDVTVASSQRTLDKELRVFVVSPASTDFSGDPAVRVLPEASGAASMRSLTIIPADANNAEQVELADALRKVTRLTAAVTGDIGLGGANDQIDIGQIYRVQCGGVIHADLTTRMENAASPGFSVAPGFDSMMYVVTGQGVTGDILVKGNMAGVNLSRNNDYDLPDNRLRARLDSLIVGPSASVGLQGNVTVEEGYIRRIFTTASIGQAGAPVNITAGRGIFEVVARSEAGSGFLNVPFYANFTANTSPILYQQELFTPLVPRANRVIHRIRTAGSINGQIKARYLMPPTGTLGGSDPSTLTNSTPDFGIIAGGSMNGKIEISNSALAVNIIAQTFTDDIVIGQTFGGTIWACGPTGHLRDVKIGDGPFAEPRPSPQDLILRPDGVPGFAGGAVAPMPAGTGPYELTYGLVNATQYSVDSVIRSKSARTIWLRGMYKGKAKFRPRVECETIDNLTIGEPYSDEALSGLAANSSGRMITGVVWSGRLETPNNDASNDYASVGAAKFFGLTSASDLWLDPSSRVDFDKIDAPGTFSAYPLSARVMGGRLRMPSLQAQETVELEAIGQGSAPTGHSQYVEDSPRRQIISELQTSDPGSIRIAAAQGLAGQIIIDRSRVVPAEDEGDEQDPLRWRGPVVIGELDPAGNPTGASIRVSANPAEASGSEFEGPLYTALPEWLGGGAIGLVPFAVHKQSSDAINASRNLLSSTLGDVDACEDVWAGVDFYGPIKTDMNPLAFPPVRTFLTVVEQNVGSLFRQRRSGNFGGSKRQIEMRGRSGAVLPPATDELLAGMRYSIRLERSSTLNDPLMCEIGRIDPLQVKAFEYEFRVGYDCDRAPDPLTGTCLEENPNECLYTLPAAFCDSIDFNQNSVYPEDADVIDFFAVLAGSEECTTCSDIDFNNNDVFPEDADVVAFFSILSGGECVTSL